MFLANRFRSRSASETHYGQRSLSQMNICPGLHVQKIALQHDDNNKACLAAINCTENYGQASSVETMLQQVALKTED